MPSVLCRRPERSRPHGGQTFCGRNESASVRVRFTRRAPCNEALTWTIHTPVAADGRACCPNGFIRRASCSGGNRRHSRYYKTKLGLGPRPEKVSHWPPKNTRRPAIGPTPLRILPPSATPPGRPPPPRPVRSLDGAAEFANSARPQSTSSGSFAATIPATGPAWPRDCSRHPQNCPP